MKGNAGFFCEKKGGGTADQLKKKHVVSLSGGKDSTALALRMREESRPMDILLFVDTGLEFPQMYAHLDKLERYLQFPITRLKPPRTFEYLFYEYMPPRKNPALEGLPGLSLCPSRFRGQ